VGEVPEEVGLRGIIVERQLEQAIVARHALTPIEVERFVPERDEVAAVELLRCASTIDAHEGVDVVPREYAAGERVEDRDGGGLAARDLDGVRPRSLDDAVGDVDAAYVLSGRRSG